MQFGQVEDTILLQTDGRTNRDHFNNPPQFCGGGLILDLFECYTQSLLYQLKHETFVSTPQTFFQLNS